MLELSTREIMVILNQIGRPKTFLLDTFFPNRKATMAEQVEIEYKKGKRPMAPFVSPRVGGKIMERDGYETKFIKPPKIAPERIITIDDINKKLMGENIFSLKTPEERAAETLADDLNELDDYITRREEWMASRMLFDGKVPVKGKGVDLVIDYGFGNIITLLADKKWSHADSDPIEQLTESHTEQIQKSGRAPDIILMANDVTSVFRANEKVQKYFDNQRMHMGVIQPTIKDSSVTHFGTINEIGCEIYTYKEWYLDDEGNEQPMIPDGTVLIGKKGIHKLVYGSVTQVEKDGYVTYEGDRVPKKIIDPDNDITKLRVTSRPVPVPEDTETWHVLKVL